MRNDSPHSEEARVFIIFMDHSTSAVCMIMNESRTVSSHSDLQYESVHDDGIEGEGYSGANVFAIRTTTQVHRELEDTTRCPGGSEDRLIQCIRDTGDI